MSANERQVGGGHYKQKDGGEEHWDRVHRLGLDYFQGQITKYVERWRLKNGVQDLEKARHFLDKYIELNTLTKADGGVVLTPEDRRYLSPAEANDLPPHPAVASYGAETWPTAWVGYTFEGADAGGFLYTCNNCNDKFRIQPHSNPNIEHKCPAIQQGSIETITE